MKIWFDKTLNLQPVTGASGECDDECDCGGGDDCPGGLAYHASSLIQDGIQNIRKRMLWTEPLHIQGFNSENWLVCNPTKSGCIAVLDQQALALLDQFHTPVTPMESMQCTPSLSVDKAERAIKLLYSLGFLQDAHSPLLTHIQNRPQTLSAWLHITNACNLRCHYCYLYKNSEYMVDDIARRAVNAIFRSASKHQYKRVQLKYAGGEASLQMNNVLAIHDYAVKQAENHSIALHGCILSNGVVLTQRAIDQFKERQIGITISLDGIGASHDAQRKFINGQGSFKYVDRTITRLLASELVPYINVTVSQRNLDGLTKLVEYLLDRELRFTFSYYRDNDCSADLRNLQYAEESMIAAMRAVFGAIERCLPKRRLVDSLLDKASLNAPHQYTCAVGRSYLVIDQHGGVAKCQADIKRTVATIDADDPLQMIRDDRSGVP